MPVAISKILWSLALQLITEKLFKEVIVTGIEVGAKSTKTDIDDKAVRYIKEAWKVK